MKCFVYRNLTRKGVWYSIKAVNGSFKGLVLGYASGLLIQNATMTVSQAGRLRVLRDGKRNVHAGIVGEIISVHNYKPRLMYLEIPETSWITREIHTNSVPITYNPYMYEHFVDKNTLQPITDAPFVSIWYKNVWAVASDGVSVNAKNVVSN